VAGSRREYLAADKPTLSIFPLLIGGMLRRGNLLLVWACLLQIQIAKTTFRITQRGCSLLTVLCWSFCRGDPLLRALTMAGKAQGLLFVVEAGPSTCEDY
jgi:hypothetical protein